MSKMRKAINKQIKSLKKKCPCYDKESEMELRSFLKRMGGCNDIGITESGHFQAMYDFSKTKDAPEGVAGITMTFFKGGLDLKYHMIGEKNEALEKKLLKDLETALNGEVEIHPLH